MQDTGTLTYAALLALPTSCAPCRERGARALAAVTAVMFYRSLQGVVLPDVAGSATSLGPELEKQERHVTAKQVTQSMRVYQLNGSRLKTFLLNLSLLCLSCMLGCLLFFEFYFLFELQVSRGSL